MHKIQRGKCNSEAWCKRLNLRQIKIKKKKMAMKKKEKGKLQ